MRLGQLVGGVDARPSSRRAVAALGVVLALLLFVVPFPHHTQADGVLWLPEKGVLRASQAGFAEKSGAISTQIPPSVYASATKTRDPATTGAEMLALANIFARCGVALSTAPVFASITSNPPVGGSLMPP